MEDSYNEQDPSQRDIYQNPLLSQKEVQHQNSNINQ